VWQTRGQVVLTTPDQIHLWGCIWISCTTGKFTDEKGRLVIILEFEVYMHILPKGTMLLRAS
jgi:hypothetical protein